MTENYLLKTENAKRLYFEAAANLPIIDFHNHISVSDIAENKSYGNIYELWLKPDPYKHRLMRICGIPERFITGDAEPFEKFRKFCTVFPMLAGNPVYDWSRMELESVFGISDLPSENNAERVKEYCKLYKGFASAVSRVSDKIKIGGPALALYIEEFLVPWLEFVKENNLKLDFISYHNYGCLGFYDAAQLGVNALNVDNHFNKHKRLVKAVAGCGYEHLPIIIDEWGTVGGGFKNITQVPELIFRETEVFSSYFAKLICKYINSDYIVDRIMLCLSGQHEMTNEFTGFRGFFTLNYIAKPIYNSFVLAAKLNENILNSTVDNKNIFVVPTADENKNLSVLVSYSNDDFNENLPEMEETVAFDENIIGKKVTVWCIDKEHTNTYRAYQKMGVDIPSDEQITLLREEGRLKPITQYTAKENEKIPLKLTANSVFLITVE